MPVISISDVAVFVRTEHKPELMLLMTGSVSLKCLQQ
jgi:hypothetical protein